MAKRYVEINAKLTGAKSQIKVIQVIFETNKQPDNGVKTELTMQGNELKKFELEIPGNKNDNNYSIMFKVEYAGSKFKSDIHILDSKVSSSSSTHTPIIIK